jgi:hypothetical protein
MWRLGCELLQDRAKTAPTLNALLGMLSQTTESAREEVYNEGREADKFADSEVGTEQKDGWIQEGVFLMRQHARNRQDLFTPLHVSGSAPVRTLCPTRITEGTFDDGKSFKIVDAWRSRAHTTLRRPWTGRTIFMIRGDRSDNRSGAPSTQR